MEMESNRTRTGVTLYERITNRQPGRADCPVHKSRSGRAVLVSIGGDGRILLKCFAGCSTKDILSALRLTWSDLFQANPNAVQRREHERKRRAEKGLEIWRNRKLNDLCVILRNIDAVIRQSGALLKFCSDNGLEHTEIAWSALEFAYKHASLLQYDFERLNSKNPPEHLAVHREWRSR